MTASETSSYPWMESSMWKGVNSTGMFRTGGGMWQYSDTLSAVIRSMVTLDRGGGLPHLCTIPELVSTSL